MLDPYRDTPSGSLLFSREVARLYLSKTEAGLSEALVAGNEYFSNSEDLLLDNGLFAPTSSVDDLLGCSLFLSASLLAEKPSTCDSLFSNFSLFNYLTREISATEIQNLYQKNKKDFNESTYMKKYVHNIRK